MKLSSTTRQLLAARREVRDMARSGYVHVSSGSRLAAPFGQKIVAVQVARELTGIFVRYEAR